MRANGHKRAIFSIDDDYTDEESKRNEKNKKVCVSSPAVMTSSPIHTSQFFFCETEDPLLL
jgi:hypothetical protein